MCTTKYHDPAKSFWIIIASPRPIQIHRTTGPLDHFPVPTNSLFFYNMQRSTI